MSARPARNPPGAGPLIAIVLAVIVLVVHARVALGGGTWDDVRYHVEVAPPRLAAADTVADGQLPTWWDGTALGVPLLGEPAHGAAYPPVWIARTPAALDLLWIVHVFWLALGVALWARRLGAGELACVIGGALIAASGLATSAALRGALPALAHLPWVGWAAAALPSEDGARRARATVALGATLGAIGLAGNLALLVDAVVLAIASSAGRASARLLAAGVGGGLAIGALQWLPAALAMPAAAGGEVAAMKLSRLLELLVPGSFGASSPTRASSPLAGAAPFLPSLFVGAPLLSCAAISRPAVRIGGVAVALGALALVSGRGGWPAWAGSPELHLAALAVLAAAHAPRGLDALLAGERRGTLALAVAVATALLALGSVFALDSEAGGLARARALVDGGLGLSCLAAALVVAWRPGAPAGRSRRGSARALVLIALVVAPSVGALRSTAPTLPRSVVTTPPAWVEAARPVRATAAPLRLFRPVGGPDDAAATSVQDAMASLAGTTAARHGIGAARSEDPARPAVHDRLWFAAAAAGGALLDRYGISLAILPGSLAEGRNLTELARRGHTALVTYPASPPAALVAEWLWIEDDATAIARLFPPGAGRGLPPGLVVLRGRGREMQDEPRAPEPCLVARWTGGSIDVTCTADQPAYAVVSSSNAEGWTVYVDGAPRAWVTADLMRRAVALEPGAHVVSWRYEAPGLVPGLALAGGGVLALAALAVVATLRRRRSTRGRAPGATS